MDSEDGWITFFEDGAAPEPAPGASDPASPGAGEQGAATPGDAAVSDAAPGDVTVGDAAPGDVAVGDAAPGGFSWQEQLPSDGITIFSSDETVLLPGGQDQAIG